MLTPTMTKNSPEQVASIGAGDIEVQLVTESDIKSYIESREKIWTYVKGCEAQFNQDKKINGEIPQEKRGSLVGYLDHKLMKNLKSEEIPSLYAALRYGEPEAPDLINFNGFYETASSLKNRDEPEDGDKAKLNQFYEDTFAELVYRADLKLEEAGKEDRSPHDYAKEILSSLINVKKVDERLNPDLLDPLINMVRERFGVEDLDAEERVDSISVNSYQSRDDLKLPPFLLKVENSANISEFASMQNKAVQVLSREGKEISPHNIMKYVMNELQEKYDELPEDDLDQEAKLRDLKDAYMQQFDVQVINSFLFLNKLPIFLRDHPLPENWQSTELSSAVSVIDQLYAVRVFDFDSRKTSKVTKYRNIAALLVRQLADFPEDLNSEKEKLKVLTRIAGHKAIDAISEGYQVEGYSLSEAIAKIQEIKDELIVFGVSIEETELEAKYKQRFSLDDLMQAGKLDQETKSRLQDIQIEGSIDNEDNGQDYSPTDMILLATDLSLKLQRVAGYRKSITQGNQNAQNQYLPQSVETAVKQFVKDKSLNNEQVRGLLDMLNGGFRFPSEDGLVDAEYFAKLATSYKETDLKGAAQELLKYRKVIDHSLPKTYAARMVQRIKSYLPYVNFSNTDRYDYVNYSDTEEVYPAVDAEKQDRHGFSLADIYRELNRRVRMLKRQDAS